jgi:hypothetical protein
MSSPVELHLTAGNATPGPRRRAQATFRALRNNAPWLLEGVKPWDGTQDHVFQKRFMELVIIDHSFIQPVSTEH